MENLKLNTITFERGTALPGEFGNLIGNTGELTKILQKCTADIVALGFKAPQEGRWPVEAFGKQYSVSLTGVHAAT